MKACLKLELIGDNANQLMKFHRNMMNDLSPGLGDAAIGKGFGSSSWVAEITGLHPKFKFDRRFLRGNKDYSESNSKGSRGVYMYFMLESGKYYHVKAAVSWKNSDRYFATVSKDGDIVRVAEDEIKKWLNDQSV